MTFLDSTERDDDATDQSVEKVSRRDQLIMLAAQLFEEEGYHQASMERLADKAGIAKPTLYHYFKSKEEILFEIHLHFIEPLIRRHTVRVQANLRPSQMLLEVIADHMDIVERSPGLLRMFFEHQRELSPERRAEVRKNRVRYRKLVEEAIALGIESGEFRQVDVRLTSFALFGMCNWASKWYLADGELSAREVAYFLWDLFWRGVQGDGAPSSA